jgi:hypothetical protein
MADISAIFGSLLLVGMAFPGLLITWWLLFPAKVQSASTRLDRNPWKCFWLGGVLTAVVILPTVILLNLPFGPAKFLGWIMITLTLAVSSLGAAGMAARMGERLAQKSNTSPAKAFLVGAVALEMAVIFPVIGWFLVLPLVIVTNLGATGLAMLGRVSNAIQAPLKAESPVQG